VSADRASERWAAARAAWGSIEVEEHVFTSWLAARPGAVEGNDADLYLACACARGDPAAIAACDRLHLSRIGEFVARHRFQAATVEDLAQQLRERLFVAGRVADYTGRGSLAAWIRVIVVRAAVDLQRKRGEALLEDTSGSGAIAALRAPGEPELDFVKETYRAAVGRAVTGSLRALPSEQRNLLRLHFIEGLTLEELAGLFFVHRATIARRLASAREAVLDEARKLLSAEVPGEPAEVESLFRLLSSRIDVTLSSALGK